MNQAPYQIVAVEDNIADVHLLREALEAIELDCNLIHISSGDKALKLVNAWREKNAELPDLVVLDLNLPIYSGIEVLQSMRALELEQEIPVVVLTTSDSPRDINSARELNVVHILRKGVGFSDICNVARYLREVLSDH